MAKFKIQKSATVNQYFDTNNVVGGTGGLTSISGGGTQVRPNVFVAGSSAGAGSILAQKGAAKFLVQDGSNFKGQCTLVNLPQANLAAGQMNIAIDTASFTGNANSYVGGATTYAYITFATSTLVGPATPTVGQFIRGAGITSTGITGNVTVTSYAVSNGLANANVSFSSQTISNVAASTFYVASYASNLTNKFVTDFSNNRYLWTFNNPTSTTVRIPGA